MRTFKKERAPLTMFICLLIIVFMALNHQSCKDPERIVSVTTDDVTDVSYTSCVVKGTLIDLGEYGIGGYGWCYSLETEPTVDDQVKNLGEGPTPGTFTDSLTFLLPNTTYYIRAYAQDKISAYYGEQLSFTTLEPTVPNLLTTVVSEIEDFSAKSGGMITDDGGAPVTRRGVCWGEEADPELSITIGDHNTDDGNGTGSFTSLLTDLTPNTEYHVRAFAVNSIGVGYGREVTFSTSSSASVPEVITGLIEVITTSSVTFNGSVTSDGGSTVIEKGFLYSKNSDAETGGQKHVSDGDNSSFSSGNEITGLETATVYYVKAYAMNSIGTGYGAIETFETLPDLPIVTTASASEITLTTALMGGEVLDHGGGVINDRGVWYGTSIDPEISGLQVHMGAGTGLFSETVSELLPGETYYIKAYATNAGGTAYGDAESFQTYASVPMTVTTVLAFGIGSTSATVGGQVTPEVGITVTETGVWYSKTADPELTGMKVIIEPVSLNFFTELTNLTEGTTYYFKAYATCDVGTQYGAEATFQTTTSATDYEGYVYQTVTIGTQVWLAENLKSTKYADGRAITLVEDASEWNDLVSSDTVYCYVNGDPDNTDEYGLLYSWAGAMRGAPSSSSVPSGVQGVCPNGWHLPSDAEWDILINFVGGEEEAGGKLREAGTAHWSFPNTGGTDDYGFTALPASYRYHVGTFGPIGNNSYFWTSTQSAASSAWYKYIYYNSVDVTTTSLGMDSGVSVRCVKD